MQTADDNLTFRPYRRADYEAAIEILRDIDPDDAVEAAGRLRSDQGQLYVLEDENDVLGITGVTPIEDTDHSAWLSWTAMQCDLATEEVMSSMLVQLCSACERQGYRKLFASETLTPLPQRARYHRLFLDSMRNAGFVEEVRHDDYYQRGEGVVFMGCRLSGVTEPAGDIEDDPRAIKISDSDEIAECDDAYYLEWDYAKKAGSSQKDLARWIKRIKKWKGRLAFLSAPSTATSVRTLMLEGGFSEAGQLSDFYEDAVHEVHYVYYLL